jgi:hypothetical protein
MNEVVGIKIDPSRNYVETLALDGDDFREINKHIGCDIFCIGARLTTGDILFVDDMGWLDRKVTRAFQFGGENTVLPRLSAFAGNGLILGVSRSGDTRSAKTTWLEALEAVHFPKPDWTISEALRNAAIKGWQIEMID